MRHFVGGMVLGVLGMIGAGSAGAYVTVYGGPEVVTTFSVFPSPNDVVVGDGLGAAVAWPGGFPNGRPSRWDASGVMTELGMPGDELGTYLDTPVAISGAGTVVGNLYTSQSQAGDSRHRAAKWEAGSATATVLGDLQARGDGYASSMAYAINHHDVVVGRSNVFPEGGRSWGYERAVWWDAAGAPHPLKDLGGDSPLWVESQAFGINEAGMVVGYSGKYDAMGVYRGERAVRWDINTGQVTELGPLGENPQGRAISGAGIINASGTVLGFSATYDAAGNYAGMYPVRWEAGTTEPTMLGAPSDIGTPLEMLSARAMNDAGVVVGYAGKLEPTGVVSGTWALRWGASGEAEKLARLCVIEEGRNDCHANDINAGGMIVGDAMWTNGQRLPEGDLFLRQAAVLWLADDVVVNLNDLIDPGLGWWLSVATSISDGGWIAGTGVYDPDGLGGTEAIEQAWMIHVPMAVPEPAGVVMMAAGAACVWRRRRTER